MKWLADLRLGVQEEPHGTVTPVGSTGSVAPHRPHYCTGGQPCQPRMRVLQRGGPLHGGLSLTNAGVAAPVREAANLELSVQPSIPDIWARPHRHMQLLEQREMQAPATSATFVCFALGSIRPKCARMVGEGECQSCRSRRCPPLQSLTAKDNSQGFSPAGLLELIAALSINSHIRCLSRHRANSVG